MESHNISKVELRNLQMEDYDQLARSFKRIYGDEDVFWTKAQIKKLITIFPEGQVVIIVDDKIVGCALSIIVDYNMVKGDHTYAQVTGNETFNTHNAKGNILYGIEVFIHPDYRGLRLARRMYEYRKELCEKLNLKAIMFGGRIPNYHKYADKMRPKEYIERVRSREIYDPVLTFQLSNDFHVRRVMRNYLPNDEESKHCATLLQWDNIYYQPPTDSYVEKRPTVRIGLVQWQMRPYNSLDDLFEQVEFFVDSVSDYKSDFILFPEYFNAPLMAKFNDMGEAQSIRAMAQYTEQIRDRFRELAISYNINIITGSMPYLKEDNSLYNVGFLCRRDGTVDMYEKIHVTPDEQKCWGLSGGSDIRYRLRTHRNRNLLRRGIPRTLASDGRRRNENTLRSVHDRHAERLLTRSCMCSGTRNRKRMLRGNSRKCGQFAARSQHGHTVCTVGSVHSLRLRIPQRRQASRSYTQHRDDTRVGCRPLAAQRTAHLRRRTQPARPPWRPLQARNEARRQGINSPTDYTHL